MQSILKKSEPGTTQAIQNLFLWVSYNQTNLALLVQQALEFLSNRNPNWSRTCSFDIRSPLAEALGNTFGDVEDFGGGDCSKHAKIDHRNV